MIAYSSRERIDILDPIKILELIREPGPVRGKGSEQIAVLTEGIWRLGSKLQ